MQQRPPQPARDLHHARIAQELAQVATDLTRRRRPRRSQVDQQQGGVVLGHRTSMAAQAGDGHTGGGMDCGHADSTDAALGSLGIPPPVRSAMATRKTATRKTVRASSEAKRGAGKQRAIQREADAANARREEKKTTAKRASKTAGKSAAKKKAVQAGLRRQPENPLPRQRQAKPGLEYKLDPQPRFLAPDYVGSGKLEGHGRAGDGRRLGHRPRGRGAVRARGRRRGDRLPERRRGREDDASPRRTGRCALHRHRRRRQGPALLRTRGAARRSIRSVASTSSSTTPHSSSTPSRWRTSPRSTCRKPCRPTSAATSTWRARRCRISTKARASSIPVRKPRCSAARSCSTTRRRRAQSTPSPSRWPATCSNAASA